MSAHFLRPIRKNITYYSSRFSYDNSVGNFPVASAILRLSTKYEIAGLRDTAVRTLSLSWPTTLDLWELREKAVTSAEGMYAPRPLLPHPMYVIRIL